MHSLFKNHWFIFSTIYLIFFFWYTNISGPLSEAEIKEAMKRFDSRNIVTPLKDRKNFLKFIQEDDGGDFYMVNYLDLNESPPIMENTGKDASANDLLDYYMEYMFPEMFSRASHPVFFGSTSANAIDHIGSPETKEWDQVGLIRYRSIRDMLEISGNEVFTERHQYKTGALIKTIAIPVASPFIIDMRIVIFMLILMLALSVDKLRKK
jgi:hypothetical protein